MMITCGNKIGHNSGTVEQHATTEDVRQCYANRYRRGLSQVNHAEEVAAVLTTLTKYAGQRAGNYCTMPSVDVEILDLPHRCGSHGWGDTRTEEPCGKVVEYDSKGGTCGWGAYVHVDGTTEHTASVMTRCAYCGTDDPSQVQYKQHAYYDAVECIRCGGVTGHGIGD